ncbi:hypothetical protein Tco_0260767 [Tanacetum coccineum]
MSNMSEDIWYAGSDTRPPMLDRTDFESWQQRIRLYCLGKDNGENIMKSITEGPFQMGTFIQTPAEDAEETEGALQLGLERARVFTDLSAEEKERYKADISQHEVHANENIMMMERFIQTTNDPLALVSNSSVHQYPTQSSESLQFSNQPSLVDNCQIDTGSTLADNLIESLTNTLALLRTSSNARNKATVEDDRVVVQDVRDRYNVNNQGRPFQRNNARGKCVARNVEVMNRVGNMIWLLQRQDAAVESHENGCCMVMRQLLFLQEELVTILMTMWMIWHQCGLSLKMINAMHSTLMYEEAPHQTMFLKKPLIEDENLIAKCLSNQLLYDVEKSCCLDLEAEIQEKDNMIRDLKVLVSNVNDRSCEPYNANDVTDLS